MYVYQFYVSYPVFCFCFFHNDKNSWHQLKLQGKPAWAFTCMSACIALKVWAQKPKFVVGFLTVLQTKAAEKMKTI